jgi:hypothetical protein
MSLHRSIPRNPTRSLRASAPALLDTSTLPGSQRSHPTRPSAPVFRQFRLHDLFSLAIRRAVHTGGARVVSIRRLINACACIVVALVGERVSAAT